MFLEGEGSRAELNSIVVGRGEAEVDLDVEIQLVGKGTRAESVSRAVAFERSKLFLRGLLVGMHDQSRGHLDCRGISFGGASEIHAIPELDAFHAPGSQLSHEAAVGPIAEEVVDYLRTRGLSRDEAIATLTTGFLNLELPGLPMFLRHQLQQMIALTADDAL